MQISFQAASLYSIVQAAAPELRRQLHAVSAAAVGGCVCERKCLSAHQGPACEGQYLVLPWLGHCSRGGPQS